MDVSFNSAIIGDLLPQYAAQDFEALPDTIPGATTNPVFNYSEQSGDIFLGFAFFGGDFTPSYNAGTEDFEVYPVGLFFVIDQSISNGSVTMSTGYITPFPTT